MSVTQTAVTSSTSTVYLVGALSPAESVAISPAVYSLPKYVLKCLLKFAYYLRGIPLQSHATRVSYQRPYARRSRFLDVGGR